MADLKAPISIRQFKARLPRYSDRLIPKENAVVAKNCDFDSGQLGPMKGLLTRATLTKAGTLKTAYCLAGNWMGWTDDVSVVKSFEDTEPGHIFYADGTQPKQTNTSLATSGTADTWPTVSNRLGVETPASAPASWQLTPASTGADPFKVVSYVYTYITARGEESAPSPPSGDITLEEGQTVIWENVDLAQPSGDSDHHNITGFRLYRLNTGSDGGGEYQLVPYVDESDTDFPLDFAAFTDNAADEDLLEVLPTEGWNPPPDSLKGLVAYRNGILAGFSGKKVYLCEPNNPHAWPYYYSFPDAIVGIAVAGGFIVVATDGCPGTLQGFDPSSLSQVFMADKQPCKSAMGICATENSVIYPAPGGLFAIAQGVGSLITRTLFTKRQWQALGPANMRCSYHDGKIYVFFNANQDGFCIDTAAEAAVIDVSTGLTAIPSAFGDGEYLNILGADKKVYAVDAGAADATYTWKSKVFQQKKKLALTHYQVIAQDGSTGDVTFSLIENGAAVFTETITPGPTVRRIVGGYGGMNSQVSLSGTAIIDSVCVGSNPDEVLYGA